MRLKLNHAAADGVFTDIVWQPLNPEVASNVLLERNPLSSMSSMSMNAYERLVERSRRSERLAEMSLGALLYYALVEEGTIADEPA